MAIATQLPGLQRRYWIAGGIVLLVALAVGIGLAVGFNSKSSNATASVDLTDGNGGVVASGPLAEIVAKASSMAGLTVEIPDPLPASAYVSSIVIPPGPGGAGVATGPAAQVYIKVPSGEYIIDELKGTIGGMDGATEVPGLESPGKTVFITPGSDGAGYAVVGQQRSFMLTPGSNASAASAKTDFPAMIRSLSVD